MSGRFAVNIGTLTSGRFAANGLKSTLSHGRIIKAINGNGFHARTSSLFHSASEPTWAMVIEDENPLSHYSAKSRIFSLAEELHQDCIACVPLVHHHRIGVPHTWEPLWERARLIGPYHQEWGTFDRAFFTLPPI